MLRQVSVLVSSISTVPFAEQQQGPAFDAVESAPPPTESLL